MNGASVDDTLRMRRMIWMHFLRMFENTFSLGDIWMHFLRMFENTFSLGEA